ncbi:hypothetical protein ACFYO7_21945 [Nocardia salmonicida]|uniref:hypothetical protein n=1 Tax=Nocardia salmonicida TaxID=53431 RepID=UPI0036A76715
MRRDGPAGHDDRGPDYHPAPGDDNGANNIAVRYYGSGDRPGNHVEPGGRGPGVVGAVATRDRGGG